MCGAATVCCEGEVRGCRQQGTCKGTLPCLCVTGCPFRVRHLSCNPLCQHPRAHRRFPRDPDLRHLTMLSLIFAPTSFTPAARSPCFAAQSASIMATMATPNAPPVYDGIYADELRQTAAAMVSALHCCHSALNLVSLSAVRAWPMNASHVPTPCACAGPAGQGPSGLR